MTPTPSAPCTATPSRAFLRYLRALVADDAEDIASETWLNVARDLTTFHGDDDQLPWLGHHHRPQPRPRPQAPHQPPPHTIAVPVEELVGLAASDDTATSAIDAVATTNAVRLIATLPADQAEAVLLRAVIGLSATTAAEVLGKRPGAVRTAAYRGLRTLARYFEQAEESNAARATSTALSLLSGQGQNRKEE